MERCEICEIETILERHHIVSRSKGGGNEISNICKICPNCHVLTHRGEIIIDGWYHSTGGYILVLSEDESLKDRCWIVGKD